MAGDEAPTEEELVRILGKARVHVYDFARSDAEWLPFLKRRTESEKDTDAPLLESNRPIGDVLLGLSYLRGLKRRCLDRNSPLAGNPRLGSLFEVLDAHVALLAVRGLDVPVKTWDPKSARGAESGGFKRFGTGARQGWAQEWRFKGEWIGRAARTLEIRVFDYYRGQLTAIVKCASSRIGQTGNAKARRQHEALAEACREMVVVLDRATNGLEMR